MLDDISVFFCAGDMGLVAEDPDIEFSSVDGKDKDSFSETVAPAK